MLPLTTQSFGYLLWPDMRDSLSVPCCVRRSVYLEFWYVFLNTHNFETLPQINNLCKYLTAFQPTNVFNVTMLYLIFHQILSECILPSLAVFYYLPNHKQVKRKIIKDGGLVHNCLKRFLWFGWKFSSISSIFSTKSKRKSRKMWAFLFIVKSFFLGGGDGNLPTTYKNLMDQSIIFFFCVTLVIWQFS